jgi:predicted metal-dependent HD superfamily phosphohydrolase
METEVLDEELVEALHELWAEAEAMYTLPSRDVHPHAYVELCLAHAAELDSGGEAAAGDIEARMSDEALAELDGKGGVTEVRTSERSLIIDDERHDHGDGWTSDRQSVWSVLTSPEWLGC